MTFNKDTYQEMFKLADQAFLANGGVVTTPAVVGAVTTAQPEEVGQVAAVAARGGGRGRGGRGRGGRGRGGGSSSNQSNPSSNQASQQTPASASSGNANKPHQRGTKHPDLPSNAGWACAQHWKKGRQAPYCSDPLVCQWVRQVVARTPTTSQSNN